MDMMARLLAIDVGVVGFLLLALASAHALPCSTAIGCSHPSPAPLFAAGIPAFLALGGGIAVQRLWRRFGRRQG
jgi:hypothetical protein